MSALNVCHINTRSLVSNFADFKQIVFNNYDLITVSETWLTANISNEIVSLPGYNIFRCDRATRGGGIAIYVKGTFKANIVPVDVNNSEQLWLSFNFQNKKYVIGTLYRSPTLPVREFLNEFENSLSIVAPKFDYIICAGDLNIDVLDPSSNAYSLLSNISDTFELKQIVEQPTRYSPTSAKLIDLIFCSEEIIVNNSSVTDCSSFSDHWLVSCSLGALRTKRQPFYYTFRDFKNFNQAAFLNDLTVCNFDQILDIDDIDKKVEVFNKLILDTFNAHAPIRTVKILKKKLPG